MVVHVICPPKKDLVPSNTDGESRYLFQFRVICKSSLSVVTSSIDTWKCFIKQNNVCVSILNTKIKTSDLYQIVKF